MATCTADLAVKIFLVAMAIKAVTAYNMALLAVGIIQL